ncbi:MAG: TetR/AcrR family transcriptional regulator [Chloroflexota bacterium]
MAAGQNPARRARPGAAQSAQAPERESASAERTSREERLLDAAARLLVRWGYRKTTIDDVAREAGVGKGTVYLHWKDKNDLFRAAILREQRRLGEEIEQRIAADPEGGLLHRVTTHGMLAALSHPLMAAMISGKSDIFNGFLEAYNPGFYQQLAGEADAYLIQMQQAGLIRADIPVSSITYLLTALKVGMINAPELLGQDKLPPMEELAEAISELIRRWLEPDPPPRGSEAGKHLYAAYVDKVKQPE